MNAVILYGIFETNRKHHLPDLTLGLAVYRYENPGVISDDDDKAIREFIGRHYDGLVKGYAEGPVAFTAAVAAGVEADKE